MNAPLRLDILSCFRFGRDRELALFNFNLRFRSRCIPKNSFLRAPLQICLLLIVAMVKTTIICCRSQSLAFTTEIKGALPFRFCFPKHIFHDQLSRLEFLEAWLALTIGLEVSKPRPMVVNAG